MDIFKPTTFSWEQLGAFKWAGLLFGVAVGATWPQIFAPYALILFIAGLVLSIFPGIAWFREH